MSTSVIYRSSTGYEAAMRLLYGRHFSARYRALTALVPCGASVVDVCCGPPILYQRWLRPKEVAYTGIDLNEHYVHQLRKLGAAAEVRDIRETRVFPRADIVIMQASLYHFLPDARPVVDKMFAAAEDRVIIAEPIRNFSASSLPLVARAAQRFTNAGSGAERNRFSEPALDALLKPYAAHLERAIVIPGGREKIYAFNR